MASTARAYSAPAHDPRLRRQPRPDFQVYPGAGRDRNIHQGLDPRVMACIKIGFAAVLVLAIVGAFRIWLSTATVQNLIVSQELTNQIDSARAAGSDLEIQQSIMSNPTRVKAMAQENLGMAPATETYYIDFANSVLATDSAGNISLAGSVAAIASSSGNASVQTPTPEDALSTSQIYS